MGILNVTPDSFSDGGRWLDHAAAVAHGRQLFEEGAAIVDVGGESTRPGAKPVPLEEELERTIPVVKDLSGFGRVSIDTRTAEVAVAAAAAGATLINDISSTLHKVAADAGVGYVAMHMQGEPQSMQENPFYNDVVSEVRDFLFAMADKAKTAGIDEVWIDPGIGFGKTTEHNLQLLNHLDELVGETPVLFGASRKGFLGVLTEVDGNKPGADDRLEASLTVAGLALYKGAQMVRVHDVKETVRVARIINALKEQ